MTLEISVLAVLTGPTIFRFCNQPNNFIKFKKLIRIQNQKHSLLL